MSGSELHLLSTEDGEKGVPYHLPSIQNQNNLQITRVSTGNDRFWQWKESLLANPKPRLVERPSLDVVTIVLLVHFGTILLIKRSPSL